MSSILHFLRQAMVPALSLWLLATPSHATPVFEPVQGFVRSPEGPRGKVIQGSDGNFYGTTYYGGRAGYGTVFKMTASGTLTTLVNFTSTNGSYPQASLVQGSDGNFYGTTSSGGSGNSGTVFKMTSTGTLTTLVNFNGPNGAESISELVQGGDGNFYGTTFGGGSDYSGTMFKMTASGTLTTLMHFNTTNGGNPRAKLIKGSDGNLYGTTQSGGIDNAGTVFKITASGTLTTLADFNPTDDGIPTGPLVQGGDGNLYGTAFGGGIHYSGTVFKVTPSGTLTTLVDFTSTDSYYSSDPDVALVQGSDGNFYGTTPYGDTVGRDGSVFKMTPSGTITTLVNFNSTNGRYPQGGLVQDSDGNFYGTTFGGGISESGTVFKMTPSGTLTTLVNFNSANGIFISNGIIQGNDGNFYGTTSSGGSIGQGTVFKMTPSGTLTTLVDFTGTNGFYPAGGLVQGSDGNFYGTTYYGGSSFYSGGTVFKMTATGTLTTLVNFNGPNGSHPQASLVQGSDGNFYGTTSSGGSGNSGTVFKMTSTGTLTTLVNFNGPNARFSGDLVQGSDGNFYGTTARGGSSNYGTVFKMTPSGTLTNLVDFNATNARYPGGLILGSDGNFYGTTSSGGSSNYGTVFKMTPSGMLTTLGDFNATNRSPNAALVQGSDGNFYGTTNFYGTIAGESSNNSGTVFKMTASGTLTTLVDFISTNGIYPVGQWPLGLMQGSDGNFYGTTSSGGTTSDGQLAGGGQIYRLRLGPTVLTQAQTNVTSNGATLKGTVNPGGYATPVSFQYGTDPTLATFSTASAGTLLVGTADIAVQASVSGLQPAVTYYYRILASNLENTVPQSGSILSFTTAIANLADGIAFPTPATVPVAVASFTATGQTAGPMTLGFNPTPGQVLTLVNNTSANPIDGEVSNLPNGGTIATSYSGRNLLFVANYAGGDGNDLALTLLNPEIAVEQLLLTNIPDGGTKSFGTVVLGSPASLVFTIKNTGPGILNGLMITQSGTDQAAFVVSASPNAPVAGPAGTTTFTVQFNPSTSGAKTATIHIASDDADENPFDIILAGTGATPTQIFNEAIATGPGLAGNDALPSATPFNDGVENLLKYAFNMNAAGPDVRVLATGGTAGLPQIAVDSSGAEPVLKVAFLRRKGSGLIYTPQRSDTLGNFQTMTGTQTVTSIDAQWERVTVQEPAPPATVPSAFARVQVSLP